MASFVANIDPGFVKQLMRLGENTDRIVQTMLDDAGQIMGDALESEIRSNHSDSSELADSIMVSEVRKSGDGWYVWAYPEGRAKSKKLTRSKTFARSKHGTKTKGKALYNTDKLWYIEHGTSKQSARPFIGRMMKNIEGQIMENMREIYEREAGK